jgi:putative transposase
MLRDKLRSMHRYIRAFVPGGTFFFTVAILERRRKLLTENIGASRAAFAGNQAKRPFTMDAVVILPDHLHCLWTLPANDGTSGYCGTRSRRIFAKLSGRGATVGSAHRGGGAWDWQRRFWKHAIREEINFERYTDYIHYNPVKHGHLCRASDASMQILPKEQSIDGISAICLTPIHPENSSSRAPCGKPRTHAVAGVI